MEKAKDIDEFVRKIAEDLSTGESVRYDLENLSFGNYDMFTLDEYREYLDMDELPDNIEEELRDWQIDTVKYLWEILELPDFIEPPRNREVIEWMVDFANEQSSDKRYIKDVQWALDSRHPFGAFKNVMAHYNLLPQWYSYREDCFEKYVRHELGLANDL